MVQNNVTRPKLVQYIGLSVYPLSVGGKKHKNTNKKEKTPKKNKLFLSVLLSIRVSVIGGRKSQPEAVILLADTQICKNTDEQLRTFFFGWCLLCGGMFLCVFVACTDSECADAQILTLFFGWRWKFAVEFNAD